MDAGAAPAGRPPFVGLTGGIASGKSESLAALERLGCAVLSTDAVVHDLLSADPDVRDQIRSRLGDGVVSGGVVDRSAVAAAVFASDGDRVWLEGLLWPRVGAHIAEWHTALNTTSPRPRAAVVEVPLLFESGMEGTFDATIAIVVDEGVRAERAGERGHAAVEGRMARQLSGEEKAARADHVVYNDGSIDDLERELAAVLDRLGGG